MTPNHLKILYVLNALFFCALIGLFLYIPSGSRVLPLGQNISGAPIGAPQAATTTSVVVGKSTNDPEALKTGPITQINGGVLTIEDVISAQTYAVSANGDTKIQLIGSQKDPAKYKKEMDAYYAQIKLLMQDPIKNKDALLLLTIPAPVELQPGTLADFAVGDSIEATAASPVTNKSFTAVKIVKLPPPAAK